MREKSKLLTAIVDDKLMIVRVHKKLLSFNFFSKQIIMSRACEIVVTTQVSTNEIPLNRQI